MELTTIRANPGVDPAPVLVPSSAQVSAVMSRFPRKDTTLEMGVRRALHRLGLRYRVALPVPGMRRRSIDIAFTRMRVAVFLDGCFWHGCPEHGRTPTSNRSWWTAKINRTKARDRETTDYLAALGWDVLRYWAHENRESIVAEITAVVRHMVVRTGGTAKHPA